MKKNAAWRRSLLLLGLLFSFTSCSFRRTLAVGGASDLADAGKTVIAAETNWEFFRLSVPGQLKTMEVLAAANPGDHQLKFNLMDGYCGYGFVVGDVLTLEEDLRGVDGGRGRELTISMYRRCLDLGANLLQSCGVNMQTPADQWAAELGRHASCEHMSMTVMRWSQAAMALASLQPSRQQVMALLPAAEAGMSWTCGQTPPPDETFCELAEPLKKARTPQGLGGNLQQANTLLQKLRSKTPPNYLVEALYLQYVGRHLLSKTEFRQALTTFIKGAEKKLEESNPQEKNILTAAALERGRVLWRHMSGGSHP